MPSTYMNPLTSKAFENTKLNFLFGSCSRQTLIVWRPICKPSKKTNLINIPSRHCELLLVGAHGGRSGHLVLFLVALLFSKLQTFLSNNPEGNPLKSVYLTPKIALKFRRIGCRNGRLVTIAICFSHSLFRATKLVFMVNYSYCRGA